MKPGTPIPDAITDVIVTLRAAGHTLDRITLIDSDHEHGERLRAFLTEAQNELRAIKSAVIAQGTL